MELPEKGANFLEQIVIDDLKSGRVNTIATRFPPEPNGYLHIGHAKSICLNFGLTEKIGGTCNLRFDDTNPEKEEPEYEKAIIRDVEWLGFKWHRLCYASDYFQQFYKCALELIRAGKAYVDLQSADQIRKTRGTLTEPGTESPYRNRSVEENLALFEKMKNGEFEEGECVLRAKIDIAHPNLNMRDPVMYRILKKPHYHAGASWCIYPLYDFAHGYEDAIEGITHSICTLEFENHRPLYDWFLDNVSIPNRPHQYEFARLNLSYTVMSKRFLLELINRGIVSDWDDPRMPTISGVRRRGYTPSSIRCFCNEIGVSRVESLVDIEFLHHVIREELNQTAPRVMVVLRPLKVVIDNYPEGKVEELTAENNPEDPGYGTRTMLFSRNLYIEEDDFMENPPKKFFRLAPGQEVRLKHAYIITCQEVVKDSSGKIIELHCTYDPTSRSGSDTSERKVKGTLHWVAEETGVRATIRLYGHLFTLKDLSLMERGKSYVDYLNPDSLITLTESLAEPALAQAKPLDRFQFLRQGYFCADLDHTREKPLFNRIVSLKDTWAKIQKQDG
ncbi:MAG: glutamine--tRNA ligase/YqeY domain fusion protein [Candidatus Atribacteria bacterium]|nr:glutamine--tRNA ligase/YqeY domain fusion protein [Candidatus Atribacteria bacterium]